MAITRKPRQSSGAAAKPVDVDALISKGGSVAGKKGEQEKDAVPVILRVPEDIRIGTRSATILPSVIGQVEDFADENKLASYFGIVPVVEQSNATERHGGITKSGSKLGRTTLVQCTLVAIRHSPYLKAVL